MVRSPLAGFDVAVLEHSSQGVLADLGGVVVGLVGAAGFEPSVERQSVQVGAVRDAVVPVLGVFLPEAGVWHG